MAQRAPRAIVSKADADAYLGALERSYQIGGARYSRKLGSWLRQAGPDERDAMLDLLDAQDPPRCDDPDARTRAARAFAELAEDRAAFRERYLGRRFMRDGHA